MHYVGFSAVEAVWIGLRQRRSSDPLQWTNENTIPYNMHYYGKFWYTPIGGAWGLYLPPTLWVPNSRAPALRS